ncbi:hypothetical protein P7K49_038552 [Saguinus oedipus]|uniref:Uncharacterized protein n=1 Tax=Saguinus oedipus TaxID=9490 RepID=A0ABQ9TF21_SAGOE|nr:hypothetical protein P7K49_038552 [Saguinus oedipus]
MMTRGGGDRYDRWDNPSWSSRNDYSQDDYRRDDKGAKPIDTAAREREVEEQVQKEQEKLQRQLDGPKLE